MPTQTVRDPGVVAATALPPPQPRDGSRVFLITRHQAATRGLMYYYTGKKCWQGHLTCRYVSTAACFDCNKLAKAAYDRARRALSRAAAP